MVCLLALLIPASPAHAYRPFSGTDADLVEVGAFEIALGPVSYLLEEGTHLLEVPRLKLNAGIHPRLEVGVGATHARILGPHASSALVGTKAGLKVLLRRGSRQDGRGPSLALELEALLPEVPGQRRAGGAIILIFTQAWPGGMIHLNLETALTRSLGMLVMGSVILEGPKGWPARPVFELLVEFEAPDELVRSALAGLLWTPVEHLRIDAALRVAQGQAGRAVLLTAGLTWSFPVWKA
jgi:hypothetical protein